MSAAPSPAEPPSPFLSEELVVRAVERLEAAATRLSPSTLLRDLIGQDDLALAYAIQQRVVGKRIESGDRWVGRKVGAVPGAGRARRGARCLGSGVLLGSMQVPNDGLAYTHTFLRPRLSAELMVHLAADLGPDPGDAEVRDAIGHVGVALEVVDNRLRDGQATLVDAIADNGSAAIYVLGASVPRTDLDLDRLVVHLREDGRPVAVGHAAASHGGPVRALQWLASTVAGYGSPLRRGEIVLTGAAGPTVPVHAGARYEASVRHVGTAAVTFSDPYDGPATQGSAGNHPL
ncbi:2-keto-4-pentenoate hydratase [Nocardioides humi]|uniref:Fumarylacetoacetate hydrolase family protein n=1 Tax=Nocardioides humi TaxID=449461 RepID=A0ABN2BRJ3_9ACTN|nr:fumarylacetoacetate hydrolase family protein [Nocardioides humi]